MGDICSGGTCRPGGPRDCNDQNACTTDGCTVTEGCTHTGIAGCCNTNEECADIDDCTVNERCVNHACVSDPRDCSDGNNCTIDTCDSESGTFGCVNTPCYEVDESLCPTLTCIPDQCGNGVVEQTNQETCDPPNSTTENGTLCRADCTYCGDGVQDVIDGEACDDGNSVEGCIKNDSFPIDDCKNNCTLHICRDPTKAVLAPMVDKFTFHGKLMVGAGVVDFTARNFSVELIGPSGQVIYRTTVPAGGITSLSGTSAGPFKFTNKLAKLQGGAQKVKIRRQGDAYRATVTAYGNLLGSQEDMSTRVRSGGALWTVEGAWERRSLKVWRFTPAAN